jgi:hypothetical protein
VWHANFTDYSRRPRLTIFSGASVRTHFSCCGISWHRVWWHGIDQEWGGTCFHFFERRTFRFCVVRAHMPTLLGPLGGAAESNLRWVPEQALRKAKDGSWLVSLKDPSIKCVCVGDLFGVHVGSRRGASPCDKNHMPTLRVQFEIYFFSRSYSNSVSDRIVRLVVRDKKHTGVCIRSEQSRASQTSADFFNQPSRECVVWPCGSASTHLRIWRARALRIFRRMFFFWTCARVSTSKKVKWKCRAFWLCIFI